MEKNLYPERTLRRILITGPESTGKSDLAIALARNFGGISVPEYARNYIKNLVRPYGYSDLEHIALQQVKEYADVDPSRPWIFFDTWLIITKVWFEVVYGRFPGWMEEKIRQASFELVLICDTDLPWIPDPVRENGGQMREELMGMYKNELDKYGMNWALVTGAGDKRLEHAVMLIKKNIQYGKS